eukprot:m.10322 g.10322  ORF g.10322 m.10322 type:complete len:135 (+) comp5543_c0_seq2:111-515(+)
MASGGANTYRFLFKGNASTVQLSIAHAGGLHEQLAGLTDKEGLIHLTEVKKGLWEVTQSLNDGVYHFMFLVDSEKWKCSSKHGRTVMSSGQSVNYIELPVLQTIDYGSLAFEDVPLIQSEEQSTSCCSWLFCCC